MRKNISRDDKLRNRRTKGVVGFHKFILKYKPKLNKPYCFVEGEDSKYYMSRIIMICKSEPEFIRCNGKKGVVEALSEIKKHKEYDGEHLLFFVDKDFDAPNENEHIYETPCYSIENFYTSQKVFERILKSEFDLDEFDDDFKNAINFFIDRQNEFHDSIALLNAWIFCYKKYIEETGENIKLRLNELSFKEHLAEVSIERVVCKYNIKDIERMLNIPTKISDSQLINTYQEMNTRPNRGSIFRGKFELEFFKVFMDKVVEDRNKKKDRKIFKNKSKVRLSLDNNIMTTLSSYAETPECLYEYISKSQNNKFRISNSSASL